jgi:hypothetical protein
VGTINQHRQRPALSALDMRHVPVSTVMAKYPAVLSWLDSNAGGDMISPESDAISFYLTNAVYAKVLQRVGLDAPLGAFEPLIEQYQAVVRRASLRLFFYLLIICTRESRHLYQDSTLYARLDKQFGCMDFTKGLRNLSSDTAAQRLIEHPPAYSMANYTDHLVAVFEQGKWGSAYGGQKWAEIAKVLRNMVHGVLSPELLLDTGFTLAHNGGPIFNKQVLYKVYNKFELLKVLDVQRAGQIPQLVASAQSGFVNTEHVKFLTEAAGLLGSELAGPVDWTAVSKNAVQSYAALVKATAKKFTAHGNVEVVDAAELVVPTPAFKGLNLPVIKAQASKAVRAGA